MIAGLAPGFGAAAAKLTVVGGNLTVAPAAATTEAIPPIRDSSGRALYPASVGGMVAGIAILYVTGLLVSG